MDSTQLNSTFPGANNFLKRESSNLNPSRSLCHAIHIFNLFTLSCKVTLFHFVDKIYHSSYIQIRFLSNPKQTTLSSRSVPILSHSLPFDITKLNWIESATLNTFYLYLSLPHRWTFNLVSLVHLKFMVPNDFHPIINRREVHLA